MEVMVDRPRSRVTREGFGSRSISLQYDQLSGQEADGLPERILRALSLNPYVPKKNLRVETHKGRVVLRGLVNSYFQKQMAQEALRRVDGIREICNELEVVGSSRLYGQ